MPNYIFKAQYEGCILTETFVRSEKETKLRKRRLFFLMCKLHVFRSALKSIFLYKLKKTTLLYECKLQRVARRVNQSRLQDVSQNQVA